jgi:hypothetical protein
MMKKSIQTPVATAAAVVLLFAVHLVSCTAQPEPAGVLQRQDCGFGSDYNPCDSKAQCDAACERKTCR